MIEFKSFGKTPRLFRDIVITEKIDGTNAAVGILNLNDYHGPYPMDTQSATEVYFDAGEDFQRGYLVYAQSRTRLIHPGMDNHGFAKWVWDNAENLVNDLGEGLHFGEWWGSGINRGYGLPKGEKRLSLFNTHRWADKEFATPNLSVVPVLYTGPFSTVSVLVRLGLLRMNGSVAAPGYDRPEGVVIYHHAANSLFKVTLENDSAPKSAI